jgi:hypothetical protein
MCPAGTTPKVNTITYDKDNLFARSGRKTYSKSITYIFNCLRKYESVWHPKSISISVNKKKDLFLSEILETPRKVGHCSRHLCWMESYHEQKFQEAPEYWTWHYCSKEVQNWEISGLWVTKIEKFIVVMDSYRISTSSQ